MRILVVEDEYKIAGAIKRGLEQESYSVDIANDGIEGYDVASTEEYDVIILDVMMPGMDGIELCSKLRKDGNKTPVLMLTARNELDDKITGLNSGADDYLTKPFAFEELLARVKALLRRPVQALDNVLTCGDLELDNISYRVSRRGKEINLSKREFALLEYLLRNKNRTLGKEQIMSHVWDYDSDILPNTVEQYIGYLRTKIDKNFKGSVKLIKTIRGFGYSISDQ
ncbi:DNA-binding response regulator [candidate division WWE3 bacterium]|jgi:DNA-binding response OmpR family regulator|uniref:DNA-binding response regulator n=1 Tax=candidate division WWE3 bacterium TaxID=2053526 RepID=A0A3A4ZFG0_UNCKA|nr:MAG: DNA-binding response regulator [candidate division WWE3 bacterium]